MIIIIQGKLPIPIYIKKGVTYLNKGGSAYGVVKVTIKEFTSFYYNWISWVRVINLFYSWLITHLNSGSYWGIPFCLEGNLG